MTKCPKCGMNEYGPGPNYDNLRWIGCYKCGFGFKDDDLAKRIAELERELATTKSAAKELLGPVITLLEKLRWATNYDDLVESELERLRNLIK